MQEPPKARLGLRVPPRNMKAPFVSAMAVLFCCAVFAIVGVFAYSRYREAQVENAAFRAQLQNPGQPAIAARMPPSLSSRSSAAEVPAPTASPKPAE